MTTDLQKKMFKELASKNIFDLAKTYAFDYADKALERNVYPTDEAISNLNHFDEELPATSGDASEVVQQLHTHGSPSTVSQIGGRYFGLVNGGVIPASLAARWLSDFWDQNVPLYVTSPISSKLEEVVEQWLKDLFGLPASVVAGFVSGTSSGILCGLAAGRYRVFKNHNWDVNKKGLNGAPKIRIIAGKQAHGTVVKAIALLGLGIDNIEWVEVDDQGRINPALIPQLDDSSILLLQAGNVNSGAFDSINEICDKANAANAWVHIDGAFGLWAGASEKLKHLTKGMEKANSWSMDAHKTLNAPYDSGILLCNDKEALIHALQASGSYIVYTENRDGMLYTPEMSRRARVIELWACLKYLGRSGVEELVLTLHKRAVQFARALQAEGFEILNDVVFNQVLVTCKNEKITQQTIENIQQSRECWVGGGKWNDQAVIRISVCSWATTETDISRSVKAFAAAREKAIGEI